MLAALRAHFAESTYVECAYFDEGVGNDSLGFTFAGVPQP